MSDRVRCDCGHKKTSHRKERERAWLVFWKKCKTTGCGCKEFTTWDKEKRERMRPKAGVPVTGSYEKRLAALEKLLAPAVAAAFGIGEPAGRRETRAKWNRGFVRWDLSERVYIGLFDRGYSADPEIRVGRGDPVTPEDRSPEHSWPDQEFGRDCKSKGYEQAVERAVVAAAQCVEDNRKMRLEHEANEKAKAQELRDIAMPQGLNAERDPKLGRYAVSITLRFDGLRPGAVLSLGEMVASMHAVVRREKMEEA